MVGKPKSCTACRQAKMACDARIKAPDPCSRCKNSQLDCCFIKNFKRVSTRQIARDITHELHIVRASQNPDEPSTPLPTCQPTTPSDRGSRSVFLLSTDVDTSSNFQLGGLFISPGVTVELLQHFERHYYPYATFVAPIQSLVRFVSDSSLLFWTIVLIASQHHGKYSHLYEDLFFPHQELLAPLSNIAIQSIENIHALLLLCLWPIPKRRILHDPSWTYIGIAVNNCMTFNCHTPLVQKYTDPGRPDLSGSLDDQTRRLTWLACFSVGNQIATFLGFVPPISSYHQLKYVRKVINQLNGFLSHEDQASLAISEIVCNYSISLDDVEDPRAHISLTNAFDGILDTVKTTYSTQWTTELDIQLQTAKLNLYATSALLPLQHNSLADAQILINRQTLFLRGLESATIVINHMKNMALLSDSNGQSPAGKLPFLPSHFFCNLFFSAVFLFHTTVYHKPLSHDHTTRAIQGMLDAQSTFQLLPHHRSLARSARLVGKLVEKAQAAGAAGSHWPLVELTVKNRLGASILWDTFARMRVRANLGRSNGEGHALQKMRLIGPDRLPPAPEMKWRLRNTEVALIRTTTTEEQELDSWASWDVDLDDFVFDFDPQMLDC